MKADSNAVDRPPTRSEYRGASMSQRAFTYARLFGRTSASRPTHHLPSASMKADSNAVDRPPVSSPEVDAPASERAFRYYTRLGRLKRHVEEHLSEPLSVREAARICGVSESYFSAFFHERVGMRFVQWLHAERVAAAKRLIERSNVSITDVALETGFGDLRSFERAFKRHAGTTPRRYKAQVRPRQNGGLDK